MEALWVAKTGLDAQQTRMSVVSNNLANVNTPAFKKGRVGFSDLMYRELARANGLAGSADNTMRSGVGVAWRYGLANIARRGRDSIVQIVAFGLGFMVLLLLALKLGDFLCTL